VYTVAQKGIEQYWQKRIIEVAYRS
jgi:hypothetical protein